MLHIGFITSLLMHLALIGWALWGLMSTRELKGPAPTAISVAILTPSDVLRLKKGSETAKQLTAKASEKKEPNVSKQKAEKPKPVTAPKPPDPIADEIAKLPPQKTEAEKQQEAEAQKKAEDAKKKAEEAKKKAEADKLAAAKKKKELEAKKAAEAKKRAEEKKRKAAEAKRKKALAKKKAAAKRKAATADRLAALLDKDPTKRGAPQTGWDTESDNTGPTAGTQDGTDTVLSAREQDLLRGMLKSQLAPCWRLPGGGGGVETPVVELRWLLRPDGSLSGEPRITRGGAGTFGRLAEEAAIRAVKSCQPFQLPPDKYQAWKDVIWEFDPSQML